MRVLAFVFLSFSMLFSFEIKVNGTVSKIEYEYVDNEYITSKNLVFDDNTNLMVKFNKITPELVKSFEEKYDLEIISVLVTGFYIYKTNGDILGKLSSILVDDANIKSVVPAWRTKVRNR